MEAAVNGFRRHIEAEPQEEEFAELFAQETASYFNNQTEELNEMMIKSEEELEETQENSSPEEE